MRKQLFITALSLFCLSSAVQAESKTLKSYKKKQAKIDAKHRQESKILIKATIKTLKARLKVATQNGKLKKANKLQKEVDILLAKIPSNRVLKDLTLLNKSIGHFSFTLNKTGMGYPLPKVNGDDAKTTYFAHAPSTLEYALPVGAKTISGYACCPAPQNWGSNGVSFLIKVDGKKIYKSRKVKGPKDLLYFNLDLPAGAQKISLIVDELDSATADHSYWMDVVVGL